MADVNFNCLNHTDLIARIAEQEAEINNLAKDFTKLEDRFYKFQFWVMTSALTALGSFILTLVQIALNNR